MAVADDGPRLDAAVQGARDGDNDAFLVLYRALQPRLLRYLTGLVGAEAEDVASETWLQVARDLSGFQGDWDAFRGWAVTIGRHRAMDHLRYKRRRPAVPVAIEEFADVPGDDDTTLSALERITTDEAIALISALPRDQAEAILLRVVIGLDAGAAGRILGKRAGAIRMATLRGLRRLAAHLEQSPQRPPVTPEPTAALREVR